MPFLPPGYENYLAYEIGRGTTEEDIDRLHQAEEKEPEGTFLQLEINWRFRFPLFEEIATAVDTGLRFLGMKPWTNLNRCIWVHPTLPIWWVCWIRIIASPVAWLKGIFEAIKPWLAKLGIAIMAVLAFFGLYRIAPRELRPPMEMLFWLPPMMIFLVAFMFIREIPGIIRRRA